MNCSVPCQNGECLSSTAGVSTCRCYEGFSGPACETSERPVLSVQAIAAIAASCVVVAIICLVLLAAVCYSIWRKYKDRNAIHVRLRRRRSVHDRYSKKFDHSMENRYNPAQFDPAMYENKAAVIAQRWDSQEQLDPTFTADPVHTGRLASSPKKPTSVLAKVTHTSQQVHSGDDFEDDDDSLDQNHLMMSQDMPLPQIDLQSNSLDGEGFLY